MVRFPAHLLATALLAAAVPLAAQQPVNPAPATAPSSTGASYAELADLVVASPLIVDAAIRSATRIKGAEAAGVAPGTMRFYVEADVLALVRGADAIPARVGWVVDVPAPDGRTPRLKKRRVLAFARTVAGRPGQLQLVDPAAQRDWTAPADATVRRIAAEVVAPDAPPVVTGVRSAFHVPGSLPGESETQIFLQTQDGRPAALSILRRPGEEPRWSVALSEIIDSGATAPARDTLLWYRLACALPAELPGTATDQLSPADADAARADYAVVIAGLGPCRGAPPAMIAPDAAPAW